MYENLIGSFENSIMGYIFLFLHPFNEKFGKYFVFLQAMDNTRLQKVGRLIQKDMGLILQQEAQNLFEGAMITVTSVRVSADLSVARIYVSIFPVRSKTVEDIFKLLEEKKAFIRMKLAEKVRHQLRIVPHIGFFLDDSLDYIQNIDNLLK